MKITLKLFAGLMDYLPAETEGKLEIRTPTEVTPHMLIDRYRLPRKEARVVMVNGEFLPPEKRDLPLRDGDVVSVWPSIQGG